MQEVNYLLKLKVLSLITPCGKIASVGESRVFDSDLGVSWSTNGNAWALQGNQHFHLPDGRCREHVLHNLITTEVSK